MPRKSTHVIVRSHHPRIKRLMLAMVVAAVAATGWTLFEYGRSRAGFDSDRAQRVQDTLNTRIEALEQENQRLRAQNSVLQKAGEVDRHAYDEVDRTLAGLQQEILELKEEVEFYRGIVNSDQAARGLQIQGFKVDQNGGSTSYQYRLVLTQLGTTNRHVHGVATMEMRGIKDGTEMELSQKDLATGAMRFRFKHFQELEGGFTIPPGFVPLQITLKAIPQGEGRSRVERVFSWSDLGQL